LTGVEGARVAVDEDVKKSGDRLAQPEEEAGRAVKDTEGSSKSGGENVVGVVFDSSRTLESDARPPQQEETDVQIDTPSMLAEVEQSQTDQGAAQTMAGAEKAAEGGGETVPAVDGGSSTYPEARVGEAGLACEQEKESTSAMGQTGVSEATKGDGVCEEAGESEPVGSGHEGVARVEERFDGDAPCDGVASGGDAPADLAHGAIVGEEVHTSESVESEGACPMPDTPTETASVPESDVDGPALKAARRRPTEMPVFPLWPDAQRRVARFQVPRGEVVVIVEMRPSTSGRERDVRMERFPTCTRIVLF
jgi:hypothetical protein